MVRSLTDLLPSKTNLSMTTDEFPPTANFVPSRKTNSPRPVPDVLILSSRYTGDRAASVPLSPVTVVLMRTASPTLSAAVVLPAASETNAATAMLQRNLDIPCTPRAAKTLSMKPT